MEWKLSRGSGRYLIQEESRRLAGKNEEDRAHFIDVAGATTEI